MAFKPVSSQVDFVALEKELLKEWYEKGIVDKYLHKNDSSKKKFSFLDGPITANNPMGVHHAWGRTYKDLWQKFNAMRGYAQRYRNGFDCQGLWVEVEVEKELGFKSKKDIETYGIANFVNKCKERVNKYSAIQTEQTKRLGNFMDWDNSYYTMSDENNYAIWDFLKSCWQRKWLYKGHESIPWCPRCETAISQHEILTEDYKEVTHESVYLKLPLVDHPGESLLVWTTTPWTIPANIAVAVDTTLKYSLVDGQWLLGPKAGATKTVSGKELVGLKYKGPYDSLEAVQKVAAHKLFHTVIATDSKIMPISSQEGTGLVHTAVSAGEEDFKLGKKLGLPMIPVIADNADYLPGLGELSGQNAKKHPEIILDYLKANGWAQRTERITHRYPACWRCKAELVWKVADEWYIAMDKPDESGNSLRKQMMAVARKITWLPSFGLDRELDWLKNMHDWLISKKNRYWGLALPIYECTHCGYFEVVGSKDELKSRAVSGWDKFVGNSPHRPWVDEVKINCSKCRQPVSRILDVGNPWLDAGIVPFSTMSREWFPADFITESFPGQFKNWFYSMIAMSTVLAKTNPFKTVFGYASLFDEKGQIMHKSAGNMIEFNEGADKIGVDVMRWTFMTHQPYDNLLFGYKVTDEVRRHFHLMLWNVYNFFVTYANIDHFVPNSKRAVLDRWILARLNQTIFQVTNSLDKYDPYSSSRTLEDLLSDISLWYVRRSRDRVGPTVPNSNDKQACLSTLYSLLTTFSQLLAPFNPYISDTIYRNLTGKESVHLSNWPKAKKLSKNDIQLIEDMKLVRKIVEMGLSQRKIAGIKVRQPLRQIIIVTSLSLSDDLARLIKDELNIKDVVWGKGEELSVTLDLDLDPQLLAEGKLRELIRQVQENRKELGARLDQKIRIILPELPADLSEFKRQTLAQDVKSGHELQIELL
ncbi:MAG: Isoleucyl-tRNA synthetase [Candidatus Amesbacteria bacterium GW2011_GWA1_47_20]|uniref:isoleucine--tRNA ligase n=2 Tax=Candidatus Amesiibacteriota TaxID=1752730 RepID=A0A0G1UVT0_9BACT|nr:MAG: Isoleucyl-tRNA synthetase [Microgenomates group bacterium GW2011_GWC1_46_20]KKU70128.1 MAG: Isoleucyl-tRNA synthetase [Candidatus Amesbacteria bacterium GW2011_GWA1_47_20]KKU83076.1 MAG: Isoleucyl-tRNA synthetase [Candidatus Amesbacteria bacterium GW2011_GWC2_47_8]